MEILSRTRLRSKTNRYIIRLKLVENRKKERQWLYSHIVMLCSLVRLPGRRMCAQLIGTFYLITSYVLLSIKISSAVSGEQLASYLLVWTFELDFGSPLGCWARLIYPQPQCSDQWASPACSKHALALSFYTARHGNWAKYQWKDRWWIDNHSFRYYFDC